MATQVSSSRLDLHGLDTAITPNPHRLHLPILVKLLPELGIAALTGDYDRPFGSAEQGTGQVEVEPAGHHDEHGCGTLTE